MAMHDVSDLGPRVEAAGGAVAMLLALDGVVLVEGELTALGHQSRRAAVNLVEQLERQAAIRRGPLLATEQQVAYIVDLFAKLADEGNTTPGGWVAGPPAEDILRGMSRREASRLIDALLRELY